MNPLLLPEHPLVVLPTLARIVGLEEAVALQQIHYWLQKSSNVIAGVPWVYNTYEQWAEQMPWLSAQSAGRLFRRLEITGYIRTERLSKGTDRTKWYTICYDKLQADHDSISNDANISKVNDEHIKSEPSYISHRLPTETTVPLLSPQLMPVVYAECAWAEGFSRIEGLAPQTIADLVRVGRLPGTEPDIGCVLAFADWWNRQPMGRRKSIVATWRNWLKNEHNVLPFTGKLIKPQVPLRGLRPLEPGESWEEIPGDPSQLTEAARCLGATAPESTWRRVSKP